MVYDFAIIVWEYLSHCSIDQPFHLYHLSHCCHVPS
jgi:hypothetical protein